MSTPRIPPVPPNKGGDLDKSSPTTSHRKVEKVDKIEKVAEVDDESRARQFRQFVDAEEETPSTLPTPFAIFSVTEEPAATPTTLAFTSSGTPTVTSDSAMEEAAEAVVPSPSYSSPPAAILSATSTDEEEADTSLPRSNQFWTSVDDTPDLNQPPMQPKMEETPRSSQRTFLSQNQPPAGTEINTNPKKKGRDAVAERGKMGQGAEGSLFGPPGKPSVGAKEEKGRLDKKGESIFSEETTSNMRKFGPEGVISPKGKEGTKYIGSLPHEREKLAPPLLYR